MTVANCGFRQIQMEGSLFRFETIGLKLSRLGRAILRCQTLTSFSRIEMP